MTGTVHGVGVGPGSADLMSVRADRLVRAAGTVAHFRKAGRPGHARRIVAGLLRADVREIAMEYPVTTEIALDDPAYNSALASFYGECIARILAVAGTGEDVVVLCEGDPFFYGSFMHLHARLAGLAAVEIVPAVTGMSAAWTATGLPVTWGDDVLTVLTGTLPEATLADHMARADALVVMKVGRNLAKIRAAADRAGVTGRAWLVENASLPGQAVLKLAEAGDRAAPYFSIVIVHGRGRRP